MTESLEKPHALEYAERPKGSRRWIIRGTLLALLLLAVASVWYARHDLTEWLSLVWIRHAAQAYAMPPGTVLMTQVPADVEKTWSADASSHYAGFGRNPIWDETEQRLVPMLPSRRGSSVTLFLHEVRTPGGERRVVHVNLSASHGTTGPWLAIDFRLFDPGTILHPQFRELTVKENSDLPVDGHIPGFPGACCMLGKVAWGSDFRMYAGKPDPTDSSRMILPYRFNGVDGSFIAQLQDDNSIHVKNNDGRKGRIWFGPPAMQPAQ